MYKLMKRFLFAILIAIMAVTSSFAVAFVASAEEATPKVYIQSTTVSQGSYAYVYVYASDFENVGSIELYVSFDESAFTYKNTYITGLNNSSICTSECDDGLVILRAISVDGISGDGVLWYMSFLTSTSADVKDYTFSLAVGEAYSTTLSPVSISAESGKVSVTKGSQVVKSISVYKKVSGDIYEGECADVTFYTTSASLISSADFEIEYDNTALELVSVDLGSTLKENTGATYSINDSISGYINISYVSLSGISGYASLVVCRFKSIANVEEKSEVSLKVSSIYDESLNAISCDGTTADICLKYTEEKVINPTISLCEYSGVDTNFTVFIVAEGKSNIGAGDFVLTFDGELLQCVAITAVENNGLVVGNPNFADGVIKLSYVNENGISEDTKITAITFAPVTSKEFETQITLTGKNLVDSDGNSIEVDLFGCDVKVEHDLETVQKKLPTCTEVGWSEYVTCKNCEYSTYEELPATGHTVVIDSAVDPTCTSTGLTEGQHCAVCDTVIVAQEVKEITPHIQAQPVRENEIKATCLYGGEYDSVVYCADCKTELSRTYVAVNAIGHTTSDWIIDVASDCTKKGIKHTECTVCGSILSLAEIEPTGHTEVTDEAVEATCTTTGLTEGSHCSVCGTVIVAQETVEKLAHTVSDWIVDVQPDCTNVGSKHTECTVCGTILSIAEIEATGHTETIDSAVVATCTSTGLTQGSHCSVCGVVLVAQKVVEKLAHTVSDWVIDVEADCTTAGSKHTYCTECNTILEVAKIEATGHTKVTDEAVDATCTSTGLTAGSHCSVCGVVLVAQEVVEKLSHTISDWVIDVQPDCVQEGSKHTYCTECNTILEVAKISATGHTEIIDEAVKATCTETGLTVGSHCSVCGVILVAQEVVDKLSHTASDWVIDVKPDCTNVGSKHTECTVCSTILEIVEIEATGHTEVVDSAVEATCANTGLTEGKHCSVCGTVIKAQEVIEKLSHTVCEWVIDVAPDCVQEGSKHTYCTECNTLLEVAKIEATGHTEVIDEAVEASCTNTGLTAGSHCSVCGVVIVEQETVEKLSHTTSEWITDVAPDCVQNGSKHTECTVCGAILEIAEIEATGHTEVTDKAIEASCTNTGLTAGSHCSVCGAVLVAQEVVEKLSHTVTDWVIDVEPTCTTVGSKHTECTVCGTILEIKEISATGHTEVTDSAVVATCTNTGLTEGKHCSVCGTVIVAQETVEKLSHTVSDWIVDVKPDCTNVGSKHTECTVCNTILEIVDISAKGHTEVTDSVVVATCTSTGLTQGSHCSVCGVVIVQQVVTQKVEHTASEAVIENSVDSSCVVAGSYDTVAYCSVCGEELSRATTTLTANGHTAGEWIVDVQSDCTHNGIRHSECTICGTVITIETISANGHIEVKDKAMEATCSNTGLTEGSHCSVCGSVLTAQTIIDKTAHTAGEWIVDVEADNSHSGSRHTECTVCGTILKIEEIPALVHELIYHEGVSATCEKDGFDAYYTCANCDYSTFKTVLATGHKYVVTYAWSDDNEICIGTAICSNDGTHVVKISAQSSSEITKSATCTATGIMTITATFDDEVFETQTKNIVMPIIAHTSVTDNEMLPTCYTTGLTEGSHCGVCGVVLVEQRVVENLAHVVSGWIIDVQPDCTNSGSRHTVCTVCGTILNIELVAPNGHTVVADEAVVATCTETGLTAGSHCSACGVVLVAQKVVEKVAHTTSEWVVDVQPTCTTAGSKHTECTVCGTILSIAEIEETGHIEVAEGAVQATCTETGLTEGKHCSVCGVALVAQETVEKLAHTASEWVIDVKPDCTNVGSKHSECTVCGMLLSIAEIEATGHTEVTDEAVQASCTETGLTEGKHCSVCGVVLVAQKVVEKISHTASDWVIDVEADCVQEGSKHTECTVCGTILEIAEIEVTGHTEVVDSAVEASCTNTGLSEGKHCSVCGVVLVAQEVVEKLSHTVSDWVVDVQATCTTAGSKHTECTVCGTILEIKEISATGHTEVTDEAVEATCTNTGLTEGKHCSVCGVVLVAQEVVEKLSHTVSDWVVDVETTCTTAGSKHTECTVCGTILEIAEIKAIGHMEVTDEAVQATCTNTGLTEGKHCSVCGAVLVAQQVVEKISHTVSNWIIDVQSDCLNVGSKHTECTVCGTILEIAEIKATGHTEVVDSAVEASCTNTGLTVGSHCSVCGVVLVVQKVTEKLSHTVSDWVIDVEPDCTQEGSKHTECTVCSTILEIVEIEVTGHTEVKDEAVKATCTSTGLTEGKHCSVCGTVLTAQEVVEKLAHTASDWVIDVQPDCVQEGSKHTYCTECNTILEVAKIDTTGHTKVTDEAVQANCTNTGLTAGSHCSVCGVVLVAQEAVGKLAHTVSDWVIDVQPDCTNVGSKHTECTVCNTILTIEEIEATGHTEVTDEAVEATCTSTGLTQGSHCSVCGAVLVAQQVVEKLSHTASDWVVDVQPDCTNDGSKHTECTVCGTILEIVEIKPTGHTGVVDEAVESTCTITGLTAGSHCSVCGTVILAQETVEKLSHTTSDWVIDVQPDCTNSGYKHTECTVCGTILTIEEIDATGHTEVADNAVQATCTSTGLTAGSHCSVCGTVLTAQEVVEKLPHTASDWVIDVEPDCIQEGSKHKYCTECNTILEVAKIEATEHTEVTDEAVDATCTSTGLTAGSHCSVCGTVLVAQGVTEKLSHTVSEWVIDVAPDCVQEGSKHTYCTECNTILEVKKIEATGHTEVIDEAVQASCTETGLTEGKHCSVCGVVLIAQQVVEKISHTSSEWIVDVQPDCTNVGSKHTECTVCKTILEIKEISATGHTEVTDEAIQPTCTSTGLTEGTHCSVCGVILVVQEVVDKLSHTLSDWVIDVQPYCTNVGSKHTECTVCGTILSIAEIEAVGHTEVTDEAVQASCTETGLTEGKHCSVCGVVLVAQEVIEKLSHTVSDWVVDVEPDCTQKGSKHTYCTECNTILEVAKIEATGHTEVTDEAVQATCTNTGLTEGKHCSVCGVVLVAQEVTEKLSHTSSDWIVDVQPDCTNVGSKHTECTVCSAILEIAEIKATGHTEVADGAVEATCTSTGLTAGSHCSVCGAVIVAQEVVEKIAHTASDWIVDVQPDCTNVGSKHTECTVCGTILEIAEISAIGHTASETVIENSVDSSCVVAGSYDTVVYCSVCGEELSRATTTLTANGHTAGEWIVYVQSDCTHNGIRHNECTVCGTVITIETISANGHIEVTDKAVEATCTNTGLTEGSHCAVCGSVLVAQTIIDKIAHTAGEWIVDVEADNSHSGSRHTECTVCGTILKIEEIPALVHELIYHEGVPATCEKDGFDAYYTCANCDYSTYKTLWATGHKYVVTYAWSDDSENCIGTAICSNDGTHVVTMSAQSSSEITKSATCTATGIMTITATFESELFETQTKHIVLSTIDHATVTDKQVDATCTNAGLTEGSHCSVCGTIIVEQNVIELLDHTAGTAVIENYTDATCLMQGSYEVVTNCSVCGVELSREINIIKAMGHTVGDWICDVAPDCTHSGSRHNECAVCGTILSIEEIEAVGHTEVVDSAVEASCTSVGLTVGSHCSVCGAVIVAQKVVEKLAHTVSDWVLDVEPACTTVGIKHTECTVCGTILSIVEIVATGHTEVTDSAVQATCTETGLTQGSHCSVCGTVIVAQKVVEKLAHTVSDWIVDVTPTCITVGSKHTECTVCGTILEISEVKATGHTEVVDEAVQATCTSTGLTEGSHCTICDETIVLQKVTEKLSHVASGWIVDSEATIYAEGSKHTECVNCGQILGEESIEKLKSVTADSENISSTNTGSGKTKKRGCRGSVGDCGMAFALAIIGFAILYIAIKRRAEKK